MPPPSPPYRPALFVLAFKLLCFFPVVADTGSRYIVYPDGIRVIEFADQDAPIKIRYHANIMGCTALAEPRHIVLGELDIDRFQSTLL